MNTENRNSLVVQGTREQQQVSIYSTQAAFESAQRVAKALASSDMVPEAYKGRVDNVLVAMEMANRMDVSPLMVMQNLDVIKGRPSFGAKFLIARVNSCGRFSPLRYKYKDLGAKTVKYSEMQYNNGNKNRVEKTATIQDRECIAYAKDYANDEIIEGPRVSVEMAVKEGWFSKSDSKWQTMPDLMLSYRAAAFFQRLYAPELSMGMSTTEEVIDITPTIDVTPTPQTSIDELNAAAKQKAKKGTVADLKEATQIKEVQQPVDSDEDDII